MLVVKSPRLGAIKPRSASAPRKTNSNAGHRAPNRGVNKRRGYQPGGDVCFCCTLVATKRNFVYINLCDRRICPIRAITQARFRHPFSRNYSQVSESLQVIKTPCLVCIKILPSKCAPPALLRHTPHKANFLRDLTAVSSSDCLQQTHQVLLHGAVTIGSP
jgi:hypothetical protein